MLTSHLQKLPNSTKERKRNAQRERRIEAEIMRLEIQPTDLRVFRTIAEFIDVFVWQGQLVDLRPLRGVK